MSVYRSRYGFTDRYRLHLSASGVMFVLVLPFRAVEAASGDWSLGHASCVCAHVTYTVSLYCGVFVLAFFAVDRYLAIAQATCANAQKLRQLMAHKLVYVGMCPSKMPFRLGAPLFPFPRPSCSQSLCVCPRVCARASLRAHVCVSLRARARVCVCPRLSARVPKSARVCVSLRARARVCVPVSERARLCMCACVSARACMCVCVCLTVYIEEHHLIPFLFIPVSLLFRCLVTGLLSGSTRHDIFPDTDRRRRRDYMPACLPGGGCGAFLGPGVPHPDGAVGSADPRSGSGGELLCHHL